MIRDIAMLGWKVGLLLMVVVPLLYLIQWAALIGGIDQSGFGVQLLLSLAQFVPTIITTVGLGAIVCLLSRIERHLRREDA
ncbi:hypothetical protein [Brevundimonas sp.]|jgi:hypothetical protein|uniref:hypothetical protein n=1 Tax=Brevundimonas sp. TaxID=1871086 RepID=UPI002E14C076|nr:hypothetical protein [Brevundimonas sp.]